MKRFLVLILAVAGLFCLVPTKAHAGESLPSIVTGGPLYETRPIAPSYSHSKQRQA